MEQPTISLIIDCVNLVGLCVIFLRIRRVNTTISRIYRQLKSPGLSSQANPTEDLTTRLEKLQSMKFSPLGNVVSLDKKRETK